MVVTGASESSLHICLKVKFQLIRYLLDQHIWHITSVLSYLQPILLHLHIMQNQSLVQSAIQMDAAAGCNMCSSHSADGSDTRTSTSRVI